MDLDGKTELAAQVREWEAEPGQKLEIPAELTQLMAYRGTLTLAKEVVHFEAGFYVILGPGWVKLRDVLVDTSERYQGITLKRRVTFRPEMIVYCSSAVILPKDRA